MADSLPPDQLELGDEEDVVWEGSPLHDYLCQEGLASDITSYASPSTSSSSGALPLVPNRMATSRGLSNVQWPQDVSRQELEVEVAQKLLSSELLVQEDEDFISNFILTDEALAALKKKSNHPQGRSFLGDALLFSGSLVAVAGTVLYLSERTRLAATAAAILPTALAALSSARSSKSETHHKEQEQHFLKLIEQLLSDMKMFKQLVRKSLNLLQGMELMHSGYMFAVNSSTGGAAGTSNGAMDPCPAKEDSPLTKALSERASFPALRKAVYQSARDMIRSYREAVTRLMEIGPLADHVDLKEHYIAFIDLAHFGIEEGEDIPDDCVSVRALKDVVQLTLIQQSEYLRRFSLAFCEKAREDHKLDEVGVVSQVKNLVSSIRKINSKLGQVFDYHQAMGLLSEKKSKSLLLSRRQKIDLLPLRSIYTSLFSTGLHLQNSLLKIRDLEKHFDHLEKSKTRDTDMFAALLPSDEHLLEWLKGFQAVQTELNACVGCLDEGVSQIDFLQAKDKATPSKLTPQNEQNQSNVEKDTQKETDILVKMSVSTSTEPVDEVFEAVIPKNGVVDESHSEGEDPIVTLERKKKSLERMQSDRVLDELRHVLVEKAAERERREALALARMNGDTQEETDREDEEVVVKVQKYCKPKSNGHVGTCNGAKSLLKPTPDAWTPISVKSELLQNGISSGFDDEFCRNDFDTLRSSNGASAKQGSPRGSETSTSSSSDPATVRSVRNYGNESLSNSSSNSSLNNSSLNDSSSDSELDELWSSKKAKGQGIRRPLQPRTGSMSSGLKAAPSLGSLPKLKAMKSSPLEGPASSCSLAELRCLSSPDITRLVEDDTSNPYVSFEDLKRNAKAKITNLSDSDSECGSADEMQHKVLKTYRRPLRPAALKAAPSRTDSGPQALKVKAKRLRNRTISLEKQDNGGSVNNGELNGHSQSAYVSKNHSESNPLFLPSRPVGFNASLAAQAAAKAMNGFSKVTGLGGSAFEKRKEEVFGSDSD
ncbi:uncharacterized protein LOC131887267 [Tigriopus californicus]|uniref:uncharacterized protein LOC131887267 n=1 Tax=Tigriopus californicus TaxID=6832 RepID=UPI0027DA31DA|nr:uncharacterized protein LOC131887267 [Tigriopus californicus]